VITYLLHRNVAHNLFWTRAPVLQQLVVADESASSKVATAVPSATCKHTPLYVTVYVFPRKAVPGAKPLTKFNPAASELAGNLLIFSGF
jgi:hypothetical protein